MKKYRIFFEIGFVLILFVFVNIFITSLGFLFDISISKWNFILSIIITIGVFLLIKFIAQKNIKQTLVPIIISGIIVFFSIVISEKIYDLSYDGNAYHKLAVGALKNGWNPVSELAEDFNVSPENSFQIPNDRNWVWVNHYAKSFWVYAGNVYSLTSNIETGKSFNFVLVFSLFFLVLSYLRTRFLKFWQSFLIALLIAVNPIVISQVLTYYNDGALSLLVIGTLLSSIIISDKKYDVNKIFKYVLFILFLCVTINIKFTGLVYAGFYCLGHLLYLIIKSIFLKKKDFDIINYIIAGAAGLIIGVLIIGYNPYIKNLKFGHPFYPLMGENSVDIISWNQPDYFSNYSPIRKNFISVFSKFANIQGYVDPLAKPEFKIPFTVHKSELNVLYVNDARISGFGLFYSGILSIALVVFGLFLYHNRKKIINFDDINYFLVPIIITILLNIFLSEAWWARYLPQSYIIPVFSLGILLYCYNKIKKPLLLITGCFMDIIMIINIVFFVRYNTIENLRQMINIHNGFNTIKDSATKNSNLLINDTYDKNLIGAIYNYYDIKNIKDKIKIVNFDSSGEIEKFYYFEVDIMENE